MNVSAELFGALVSGLVLAIGFGLRPRPPARTIRPDHSEPRPRQQSRLGKRRTFSRVSSLRSDSVVTADQVAAWCDRIARAARTGSPLLSAIREVEPPECLRDRFAEILHELDRGRPLDEAFAGLPASPDLDLAVTALLACRTNGIDPALPLEHVATVLRWRAADSAELRSQSAQARASSKVMTILPIVMLVLLLGTSAMVRAAVVTPVGLLALAGGIVLNMGGWAWMRHLIQRAIR